MVGLAGTVPMAGRGKGLRIQQPQHEIADQGSFLAQWGQWLWVASMGEIFCCKEIRQRDFTGGAQQPLTVSGMMEGEKIE